jgi:6-phosphogluconolactonase (cycloisomerase 2 family)
VNPGNGSLTSFEKTWTWVRGETPRFFTPDPEGNFLYACNQNTDNIAIFDIDDNARKPRFTGRFVGAGNPVCMVFV